MPLDPVVEAALVTVGGVAIGGAWTWWRTRDISKAAANADRARADSLEASATMANARATLALIPALEKRIDDLESARTRDRQQYQATIKEYEVRAANLEVHLSQVTAELIETKERLELSEETIQDLRNGVAILGGQLSELHVTPRYQPPASRQSGMIGPTPNQPLGRGPQAT